MPVPTAASLALSDAERKQLKAIRHHRGTPRGIVLRINILLGAAEGLANRIWRGDCPRRCRPCCYGESDMQAMT